MKKIFYSFVLFFATAGQVLANPACIVCTVAIGASLSIARKLGVSDYVIGLWLGAILSLMGYWSILWFEKKQWNFWGRDYLLMLLSLSLVGGVYIKHLRYRPQVLCYVLYLDKFLFSTILGAGIYILSQKLYKFLKQQNGGHAHFPFEKVVLPLALLAIASIFI